MLDDQKTMDRPPGQQANIDQQSANGISRHVANQCLQWPTLERLPVVVLICSDVLLNDTESWVINSHNIRSWLKLHTWVKLQKCPQIRPHIKVCFNMGGAARKFNEKRCQTVTSVAAGRGSFGARLCTACVKMGSVWPNCWLISDGFSNGSSPGTSQPPKKTTGDGVPRYHYDHTVSYWIILPSGKLT